MIPNSMFQERDICIGVCCFLSIVWCTGKVFDFVWVEFRFMHSMLGCLSNP